VKDFRQNDCSLDADLDFGPPKYEARVPFHATTFVISCYVCIHYWENCDARNIVETVYKETPCQQKVCL
jgi:hypothetical protein